MGTSIEHNGVALVHAYADKEGPLWPDWLNSPGPAVPRDRGEGRPESVSPVATAAKPAAVGLRLFFSGEDGMPCSPERSYMWCWEGGPEWFYTRERLAPPHYLAVKATAKLACKRCVRRKLRVAWQTFSNGAKHLRCECVYCGGFVEHVKPPPGNLDLEYRTIG